MSTINVRRDKSSSSLPFPFPLLHVLSPWAGASSPPCPLISSLSLRARRRRQHPLHAADETETMKVDGGSRPLGTAGDSLGDRTWDGTVDWRIEVQEFGAAQRCGAPWSCESIAPWSSESKKGVDGGSNLPKMHPESGDKGYLKREDPDVAP
jgi:hypothetical protein